MTVTRIGELKPGVSGSVRIPIMGQSLCAGFPSPADDFVEDALDLPRWLAPNPPATFLWRIAGDSMQGAGIYDRDLACVDRSLTPQDGSVVVAAIDGAMSIKRYRRDGARAWLAFENPDLPVFAVEDLSDGIIWGVVRFTIHWHTSKAALKR